MLWLQGSDIVKQPLQDENSLFIYNGDVFGGELSDQSCIEMGDTVLFWGKLKDNHDISRTLSNIQGPYAFIYLDKLKNKLYFGRDIYGRRSLLIGINKTGVILTSVAKRNTDFNFIELPSIGTFSIDLNTENWKIFPWRVKNRNFYSKLQELEGFLTKTIYLNEVQSIPSKMFTFPNDNELLLIDEIIKQKPDEIFKFLLSNSLWFNKIVELNNILEIAVKKRISTQPKFCSNCFKQSDCEHCQTGVLFSGGVDCSLLALLADKFTDPKRPIDLINVAFERVEEYKTPDRITGLQTLQELKKLCPTRRWNFVEVNVTTEELDITRSEVISDLIYPLNTILDDSLGCALWFAARAKGQDYRSPCRVLLVGMGADELFGGYTRHRAALKSKDWLNLHNTLEEDWQNLSHRNLGRDDRVVSDHGRQLRTPYLDEDLVKFVRNLNCWEKYKFSFFTSIILIRIVCRTLPLSEIPQGIGEKILLRSLAYHLGLKESASLKKRALQFGSRIANPKENAHQVSQRLIGK